MVCDVKVKAAKIPCLIGQLVNQKKKSSTSLITDYLFDYCLVFEAFKILGLFLLIPNSERQLLQSHQGSI